MNYNAIGSFDCPYDVGAIGIVELSNLAAVTGQDLVHLLHLVVADAHPADARPFEDLQRVPHLQKKINTKKDSV